MNAKNIFREAGWRSVKSSMSGVYEKNGFYLSLNRSAKVFPGNQTVTEDALSSALLVYDVRGITWHLEKDGWYLDGGKMDMSWEDILQRVEQLVKLNDIELYAYKQRFITKSRTESVMDAVQVDAPVTNTLTFKVTEVYDAFLPEEVYSIINVVDDIVYVQKYNKALTKLLSTVYLVSDVKAFFAANKDGRIMTVSIQPTLKEILYSELTHVVDAPSVLLPDVLDVKMSTTRKVAIAAAFASAKDFSILLDLEYKDDCIPALTKLVDSGVDTDVFAKRGIEANVLEKLVDLYVSGKDVTRFLSAQSINELGILEADSNNFLSEREQGLRKLHVNYGVIRALSRFAYTPGIMKYSACKSEPEVYLMKRADEGGNYAIIDALLTCGVLTDDYLTCSWQPLEQNVKIFMRRYLSASGLIFKEMQWDYWLDKFISASIALYYSFDTGYCISYGGYLIGRNQHSVFILKTRKEPVWRATLVNNEWVTTKNLEAGIDM